MVPILSDTVVSVRDPGQQSPLPSLTPLPYCILTSCPPSQVRSGFPLPLPPRSKQSFSGPLTSLESTLGEPHPLCPNYARWELQGLWAGAPLPLPSWAESWRIKPWFLAPLTGCSNFSKPAGGSRPLRKVLALVSDSHLACGAGLTQCLHPESFDPSSWA